ncbi:MAG: glutamate--cysteine ligase [alpha proteobacterium HIMB59]|nr:MAG: glutamate--cysteine ligase [alpha proteobacterium HIMB59]|tara:strand:+ start:13269 stop:14606 length:1338 start_codon:yes stop_codon:yes gene_type:complete
MLQKSDLINYFHSSFTDKDHKGIGTEHEKFIFHCKNKKRIEFDGEVSIQNLFKFLLSKGWQKNEYNAYNQLISLSKNGASVTLEPGCQLELSGKILKNVHQTCTETYEHLNELQEYAEQNNLCIIGMGFDPISDLDSINFIPKDRYKIMKNYMPKVGTRGLDMMTRTCTVQANFDYFDNEDLIKKFVVSNRIQPIVMSLFCNSPFKESQKNNLLSNRIHTWQDTDGERCGIKTNFINKNFSIEEYVDYVLSVKNYFLKINGKHVDTTQYSFLELLNKSTNDSNLNDYSLSITDWINHLSTIFTEVRLKSYMEVRGADAGKWEMICALPAFWTGILYDEENLETLWQETHSWSYDEILNLYNNVPKYGLQCEFMKKKVYIEAQRLLEIAISGLNRRAYLNSNGQDESIHLDKLKNIIKDQKTPADVLIEEFNQSQNLNSLLNQRYY